MLECITFILSMILKFLRMLFEIDIGITSLGMIMCVTFIFLPTMLLIIDFLKSSSGDASVLRSFTGKKGGNN